MRPFVLQRLLLLLPQVLAVVVVSFFLLELAPSDPASLSLAETSTYPTRTAQRKAYEDKARQLGLHLPVFYFSIGFTSIPDSVFGLAHPQHRKALLALAEHTGNWEVVDGYYRQAQTLRNKLEAGPTDSNDAAWTLLNDMLRQTNPRYIRSMADSLAALTPSLNGQTAALKQSCAKLATSTPWYRRLVPRLNWHGQRNRFHRWLTDLATGNLGRSLEFGQPVSSMLASALPASLAVGFLSLLLVFGLGIPMGIWMAEHANRPAERRVNYLLYALYALPLFWLGGLLLNLLASGQLGPVWFPAGQLQSLENTPEWSLAQRLADWAWHLALPVLCVALGSWAYVARHMRSALSSQLLAGHLRTALAKGLTWRLAVHRHAVRNALLPMVTLLGGVLPSLVGGSVVVENIFSLPGMGNLSYEAIASRDHPVVIGVFTLLAIATQVGILLADVLYAWLDPRIRSRWHEA